MYFRIPLLLAALALSTLSPASAYDPLNEAIKGFCAFDKESVLQSDSTKIGGAARIDDPPTDQILPLAEGVEIKCTLRSSLKDKILTRNLDCAGEIDQSKFNDIKNNIDAAKKEHESLNLHDTAKGLMWLQFLDGTGTILPRDKIKDKPVKELISTLRCSELKFTIMMRLAFKEEKKRRMNRRKKSDDHDMAIVVYFGIMFEQCRHIDDPSSAGLLHLTSVLHKLPLVLLNTAFNKVTY